MIAVCLCLVYQIQLPFCSRCRKLTAIEVRLTMQGEQKLPVIFQRHNASHHFFTQSAAEYFYCHMLGYRTGCRDQMGTCKTCLWAVRKEVNVMFSSLYLACLSSLSLNLTLDPLSMLVFPVPLHPPYKPI